MLVLKSKLDRAQLELSLVQATIPQIRSFYEGQISTLKDQVRWLERQLERQLEKPEPAPAQPMLPLEVTEEEALPEGAIPVVSMMSRLDEIYGDGLPVEEIERRQAAYRENQARKAQAELEAVNEELEALNLR